MSLDHYVSLRMHIPIESVDPLGVKGGENGLLVWIIMRVERGAR